ncbi:MAG: DEAD/DEAH box helicase family protein [Spirochaetes bacterium]|nr:DEAD/DEAH box helicase family protein [Spirochaetota bacterium]
MTRTEAQTRKEIIDKKLAAAGWNLDDRTQVIEEHDILVSDERTKESHSPYAGHQYSDYVLVGKDGSFLAVVEAKKTSKDAELGREQAKQYCHNIQKEKGGDLPFCFYTNGHDIFFWDLDRYPPRKVFGFPTRDDLERFAYIRAHNKALAGELINTFITGRDYQIRAIRAVMEALEKKKRKFLLVMATGTGKTRVCVSFVSALMRAGWAVRVLFLVDRIALRDQALEAFKEYLPDEPRWPHVGEKEIVKDRRIYVSTYPTMLNIIRDEKNPLSPHFFDLIVIDESHRSIYNTYQEIIKYFNTIVLGLTATPTDVIDHNTFELFDCEDGLPTFAFSYDEAINHIPPYLCNFQVMKIKTRFQEEGINKRTISLEDQKKLMLEGKEIEEINYEGTELEKTVINQGTNALIVKEFMEESIKDANGVLPGKTVFFCVSKSHARRIEKIFDALYPEYKGELAKVIVSDDPRVYGKGGLLDQFKTNDMPRIAVSVDMLDTGIDVREILNLVFAKPVYSYTKFWQMIGRGTRLLEEAKIRPWCTKKDVFLIMDCWDNFEYFKVTPKGKDLPPQVPLPVRYAGLRIDKIEKALSLHKEEIARKEIGLLQKQIEALPAGSVTIMEAASDLEKCKDPNFWNRLTGQKIEFLRTVIKPLFRTISQVDFKAMRFKKDLLETSLALLAGEKDKYENLKANVIEQISELPLSVNIVADERALIESSQTSAFWKTISDSSFDELGERLAPLMKFREGQGTGNEQVRLNLKDLVHTKEMIEFGPEHEALSVAKYRELVEERIRELTRANPILQKIKKGEAVTDEEARRLAEELHDEHPHITIELLRRAYNNQKAQFVQFIRHILGIEVLESFPESVSKAVDMFIRKHSNLTGRQMDFLTLLKNYIIERGGLEKRDLIEAPFTQIHPEGIRGIFGQREIDEILELTRVLVA